MKFEQKKLVKNYKNCKISKFDKIILRQFLANHTYQNQDTDQIHSFSASEWQYIGSWLLKTWATEQFLEIEFSATKQQVPKSLN